MKKTLTNLLRSVFAIACCICGMQAYAQTEGLTVIAAGGTTDDSYVCTIGQTFVSETAGLWVGAENIVSGIDGIYSNGGVIVENTKGDNSLKVQLTDEMVAQGAFYNVFTVSGMLLESNKIDSTSYNLNYSHLLSSKYIIITINTSKGVVATYKLSK